MEGGRERRSEVPARSLTADGPTLLQSKEFPLACDLPRDNGGRQKGVIADAFPRG